jgi:hypothetical protein
VLRRQPHLQQKPRRADVPADAATQSRHALTHAGETVAGHDGRRRGVAAIILQAQHQLIVLLLQDEFATAGAAAAQAVGEALLGTAQERFGAYTAFFVFGGSRLLAQFLTGPGEGLSLLFWFGPGVIGSVATAVLTRQYRQRFAAARPQGT